MKQMAFALALAALLGAAPAFGQASPVAHPAFDGADTNQDGQISAAEFSARQTARFKTLDVNGDGFLTAEDRAGAGQGRLAGRAAGAAGGPPGGGLLARFDADGDKKISPAEFAAAGQQQFTRADSDGNANVTQAELQALRPLQR